MKTYTITLNEEQVKQIIDCVDMFYQALADGDGESKCVCTHQDCMHYDETEPNRCNFLYQAEKCKRNAKPSPEN